MFYDMPGFDPKTFSDEELLKKSDELMRKISWSSRFSTNMMGQLQNMLIMIDNERRERIILDNWKNSENYFTATIESDPDVINKEEEPKVKKSNRKPVFKITANPVIATTKPISPKKEE